MPAEQTEALENNEVHVDPDNQGDANLGDADGDGHQDGGPKPPTPEQDVVRQLAVKAGWKPKEDWKGEGWTEADVFLEHQLEKGQKSKNQLRQVASQLRSMENLTKAQRKAELDAQLAEAVKAGDVALAREVVAAQSVVDENPAVTDFRTRNDWFGVDPEATAYVEALDKRFAGEPGGIKDAKAHMKRIEEAVLKRFPEHASDGAAEPEAKPSARRTAPLVARSTAANRNSGGKVTGATLSADEVSAFNQLKSAGVVQDRNEYAKLLNEQGARENA